MKTILTTKPREDLMNPKSIPVQSNWCHKNYSLPLLLLCISLGAGTAQAASPDAVLAWGKNDYGQTTVPVAAQSGVTAIAAAYYHTVALLGSAGQVGPSLILRSSGNELILSWPTNAVGFSLESTLQLTPAAWVAVTNPPALLGAQWAVTNIFSATARFYRLRKP